MTIELETEVCGLMNECISCVNAIIKKGVDLRRGQSQSSQWLRF